MCVHVCVQLWEVCVVCVVRGVNETAGPSTDTADDDVFNYLNANRRQGTWGESEAEKVIKSITTFAKSYKGDLLNYLCQCILLIT